jgi:hypothetical protein
MTASAGTSAGAGNLIAFNGGDGIASNRINIHGAVLSNSIHSNAGLGIDINDDGVSPDAAVCASARRPTLTSVTNTDAGTVITGTVPNHNSFTPYTVQFFSNPACDPSGHGEGQTLIGATTVTPTTQNVPSTSATRQSRRYRAARSSPPSPSARTMATGYPAPSTRRSSPTARHWPRAPTPTQTPPTPRHTTPHQRRCKLVRDCPDRGGDTAA